MGRRAELQRLRQQVQVDRRLNNLAACKPRLQYGACNFPLATISWGDALVGSVIGGAARRQARTDCHGSGPRAQGATPPC